jgi:hypothetical protein
MTLIAVITLATIGETVIEAFKPLLAPFADFAASFGLKLFLYLSLLVGIALALNYQADLLSALLTAATGEEYQTTLLGILLTGALLGRGSNVVHDLINRIKPGD